MKKLIGIVLCALLLAALPAMARQADTAADIGMEEAQRIALEHAGILDPETAFVLKCEKDWENGRTVYEVEFVVDAKEYDYDIDASTGEVVAFDGDAESYQPLEGEITITEALDIALDKAGLTRDQVQVTTSKLEQDNNRRIYELEFFHDYVEYEVEIDAATGTILDWDRD